MAVDEQDGPAKGWTWAADAKVIQGGKTDVPLPVVSARAGVPAAGRGTQLDPDKSMRGLEAATTPLAHPTGVDAIDSFTSPVGLASLAAGGVGIARAGVAGGVGAAAKASIAEASPVMKFEVTRRALTAIGVPDVLATGAAALVAGYKGKGAEAEAAVPTGPHMDRSIPVRPSELTKEQLSQRILQPGGLSAEARAQFDAAKAARNGPIGVTAQPPATEPIAAPAPASPAAAASGPPAASSAVPSSVGKAMNDLLQMAKEAKSAGKPTLRTSEQVNQAFKLVVSGMTPAEAFGQVTQPAAAGFATTFGLPNDAAMKAQIAARQYKQ